MNGSTFYPLSQQIKDNVLAHGLTWTTSYYIGRGVPLAEFVLLARGAGVLSSGAQA